MDISSLPKQALDMSAVQIHRYIIEVDCSLGQLKFAKLKDKKLKTNFTAFKHHKMNKFGFGIAREIFFNRHLRAGLPVFFVQISAVVDIKNKKILFV